MLKDSGLFPCRIFFAAGKTKWGIAALLMQISLVLWPWAAEWARRYARDVDLEKRLGDLARAYSLPVGQMPTKGKRFAAAA